MRSTPVIPIFDRGRKGNKNYEKDHLMQINLDGNNMNKERVCISMIRSVNKLFYKDNVSDPQLFKTYLTQHIKNISWKKFKGNRFNVILHCSCSSPNKRFDNSTFREYFYTVLCINLFKKKSLLLAMCHALGIVYISITRP